MWIGDSSCGQPIRHFEARHSNVIVGHPIIDIEVLR